MGGTTCGSGVSSPFGPAGRGNSGQALNGNYWFARSAAVAVAMYFE